MQLIETTVTDRAIRVRLADCGDPAKATEWIDCQLQLSGLKRASGTQAQNLGILDLRVVQQVALENARDALVAEIARLQSP